jgi:hypothetical protein
MVQLCILFDASSVAFQFVNQAPSAAACVVQPTHRSAASAFSFTWYRTTTAHESWLPCGILYSLVSNSRACLFLSMGFRACTCSCMACMHVHAQKSWGCSCVPAATASLRGTSFASIKRAFGVCSLLQLALLNLIQFSCCDFRFAWIRSTRLLPAFWAWWCMPLRVAYSPHLLTHWV